MPGNDELKREAGREGVGAVALGAELKDFPAAVAVRLLSAMEATVELEGEHLNVRLPAA